MEYHKFIVLKNVLLATKGLTQPDERTIEISRLMSRTATSSASTRIDLNEILYRDDPMNKNPNAHKRMESIISLIMSTEPITYYTDDEIAIAAKLLADNIPKECMTSCKDVMGGSHKNCYKALLTKLAPGTLPKFNKYPKGSDVNWLKKFRTIANDCEDDKPMRLLYQVAIHTLFEVILKRY